MKYYIFIWIKNLFNLKFYNEKNNLIKSPQEKT